MPTQPLRPFSPPTQLLAHLPPGVSVNTIIEMIVGLVFLFWIVYTLVAIYHWFKYSHGSPVATPAIAIHLVVSVVLMLYALSGTFL